MKVLTLDDFDLKGKTVFVRMDMNCPIDPETGEILGTKRIEEAIETLESLKDAKVVIASHQGRVGNNEYTGMNKHAEVLEKLMDRKIKYVEDTIGEAAQNAIPDNAVNKYEKEFTVSSAINMPTKAQISII